uniref:NAD/NADP transhydrogenase beta subunit n=2 Tax=Gloeothece TaxID=28070 RepID=E0UND8_GLOV7|nr:conserved hypothetical protein [Gloeothece verrucosa PCC 7822]
MFILMQSSEITPQEFLKEAQKAQELVSIAMDKLWIDVITSDLYKIIADLGSFFAVCTIALSVVIMVKELLADELALPPYEKLLWLFIVVVLLGNGGVWLGQATLQYRNLLNGINQQVLTKTAANLDKAYAQASGELTIDIWTSQQIQQKCSTMTDPDLKQQCIDAIKKNAQEMANQQLPQNPSQDFFDSLGKAIASQLETIVIGWMLACSIAFQWIVEVTWVLTGLLGPMAVGGTLLPVAQKSLFTWLIAFYSVGLCKLCFNILIALIAVLQTSSPSANKLIFSIAVGVLSPILAVALAAGGGMATFSSLATITGAVAGMAGAKMGGAMMTGAKSSGATGMGFVLSAMSAGNRAASFVRHRRSSGNSSTVTVIPSTSHRISEASSGVRTIDVTSTRNALPPASKS